MLACVADSCRWPEAGKAANAGNSRQKTSTYLMRDRELVNRFPESRQHLIGRDICQSGSELTICGERASCPEPHRRGRRWQNRPGTKAQTRNRNRGIHDSIGIFKVYLPTFKSKVQISLQTRQEKVTQEENHPGRISTRAKEKNKTMRLPTPLHGHVQGTTKAGRPDDFGVFVAGIKPPQSFYNIPSYKRSNLILVRTRSLSMTRSQGGRTRNRTGCMGHCAARAHRRSLCC